MGFGSGLGFFVIKVTQNLQRWQSLGLVYACLYCERNILSLKKKVIHWILNYLWVPVSDRVPVTQLQLAKKKRMLKR